MIWDHFTYMTPIREMEDDPTKLRPYIIATLTNIARVAQPLQGDFISPEDQPLELTGAVLESASRMAAAQVVYDQLLSHLGLACSTALDRGIRPSMALTEEARDPRNGQSFPKVLDEYGMIYSAHTKLSGFFKEHVSDNQYLTPASSYDRHPLRIEWNTDKSLSEHAARYLVSKTAFDVAKQNVIGECISSPYSIEGWER
jgi:hypothetical protein